MGMRWWAYFSDVKTQGKGNYEKLKYTNLVVSLMLLEVVISSPQVTEIISQTKDLLGIIKLDFFIENKSK